MTSSNNVSRGLKDPTECFGNSLQPHRNQEKRLPSFRHRHLISQGPETNQTCYSEHSTLMQWVMVKVHLSSHHQRPNQQPRTLPILSLLPTRNAETPENPETRQKTQIQLKTNRKSERKLVVAGESLLRLIFSREGKENPAHMHLPNKFPLIRITLLMFNADQRFSLVQWFTGFSFNKAYLVPLCNLVYISQPYKTL